MKSHRQTTSPSRLSTRGGSPRFAARHDGFAVPRSTGSDRQPTRCHVTQRRGAAAVEFAVVLPILVTCLLGAADFGRCSYSSIAVANAARSGAAYGITNPYTSSSLAAWQTGVTQAAIDEFSQSSVFDTSKLTVSITTTTEASGLRRVSVQATYPFTTTVNWSYIPHTFDLTQTAVMRGIR